MLDISITSLFSALFALALIPLTIQVGLLRLKTEIFYGDGSNSHLARRRAAQSNFVQYVPFALFLLLLCEMSEVPRPWLLAIGGTLLLGRSLHAWCLLTSDGLGNARAAGMLLTFSSFLISAGWLIVRHVGGVVPT